MKQTFQEKLASFLFLAPFLLAVCVFFIYAVVRTIYFSFTDYNMFNEPQWIGWQNYFNILGDGLFLKALSNTLLYSIIITFLQTLLGLMLAIAIDKKVRGISFFRTAFYFPSILSSAAVTLIFLWVYQKEGLLNQFLSWFSTNIWMILSFCAMGIGSLVLLTLKDRRAGFPATWLEPQNALLALIIAIIATVALSFFGAFLNPDPDTIRVSWLNTTESFMGLPVPMWSITMQNLYTTAPSMMLLFLAGLQNIPNEYYEVAKMEGASFWQTFTNVIVPSLKPVIFLVTTSSLIGTLQLFDQVALYGDSAPLESKVTLAYYIYDAAFPSGSTPRTGEASAAAIILSVLTLIIVTLQKYLKLGNSGERA